jgi:hypothetical protein
MMNASAHSGQLALITAPLFDRVLFPSLFIPPTPVVEPAITTIGPLTPGRWRPFPSLSEAVLEINDARVFGGIHFRTSCLHGNALELRSHVLYCDTRYDQFSGCAGPGDVEAERCAVVSE